MAGDILGARLNGGACHCRCRAARHLRRRDVCLREIATLEQQRFVLRARERVRETVPEVQRRRMIALAVTAPCLAGNVELVCGDRHRRNVGAGEECIERIASGPPTAAFHNHGRFQYVRYGHATGRGGDQRLKPGSIFLLEEHCEQRGRVHDHLGSPRSS